MNIHKRIALRAGGFTLVELMIVVVIASILAAIAIPAYTHQIRESRRTDARTALLDAAAREERYYTANNAYTLTASDLGYQGSSGSSVVVGSGYYTLTLDAVLADASKTPATPASFTATATPVAGKGQDQDSDCQSFTVDSTGAQSSTNGSATDTTATCWK